MKKIFFLVVGLIGATALGLEREDLKNVCGKPWSSPHEKVKALVETIDHFINLHQYVTDEYKIDERSVRLERPIASVESNWDRVNEFLTKNSPTAVVDHSFFEVTIIAPTGLLGAAKIDGHLRASKDKSEDYQELLLRVDSIGNLPVKCTHMDDTACMMVTRLLGGDYIGFRCHYDGSEFAWFPPFHTTPPEED